MDKNIIITLVSSIVIPWCLLVIKRRKSLGGPAVLTGYLMLALWIFMIGMPNIPFLISPFTPPIQGKVVEARTELPIANCNVKAYWELEEIGFAGGHWESYRQFVTKTDAQGEFVIPRRLKVLSVWGFLPALEIISHHNGIRLLAYAHGYSYVEEKVVRQNLDNLWQTSKLTIKMYPPSETYLREQIYSLESKFESWNIPNRVLSDEDELFLKEDYSHNYGLFNLLIKGEKSIKNESTLINYASSLKRLGDYKTALKVYQKLKNDYPESAQFAEQEIEMLQRNLRGKSGGGK